MPNRLDGGRKRGRPPAHSRDEIVDIAVDLGLRNLTVADVSGRMGIPTASMYSYVSGREDLQRAVADRLVARLAVADPPHAGPGQVAVETGLALYALAMAHPGLAEYYLSHSWASLLAFEEEFASALCRRGLAPAGAVLVTDAVVAMTMGEVIHRQAEDHGEDGEFEDSLGVARPTYWAARPIVDALRDEDRFAWKLRAAVAGMVEAVASGAMGTAQG